MNSSVYIFTEWYCDVWCLAKLQVVDNNCLQHVKNASLVITWCRRLIISAWLKTSRCRAEVADAETSPSNCTCNDANLPPQRAVTQTSWLPSSVLRCYSCVVNSVVVDRDESMWLLNFQFQQFSSHRMWEKKATCSFLLACSVIYVLFRWCFWTTVKMCLLWYANSPPASHFSSIAYFFCSSR